MTEAINIYSVGVIYFIEGITFFISEDYLARRHRRYICFDFLPTLRHSFSVIKRLFRLKMVKNIH